MRVRLENNILVSLAGPAAERRITRRKNRVGASFDYDSAADVAMHICQTERSVNSYLKWLGIRIDEMLEDPTNWRCVEALALALLDRETIPGSEVAEIIFQAADGSIG